MTTNTQAKLRPLGDRILVQRDKNEEKNIGGIILPDSAQSKQDTGTVLAIGPGKKDKDGKKVPMMLKSAFYNAFLKNRDTLTIIGPANLVKEIRKNPNRIDLMMD